MVHAKNLPTEDLPFPQLKAFFGLIKSDNRNTPPTQVFHALTFLQTFRDTYIQRLANPGSSDPSLLMTEQSLSDFLAWADVQHSSNGSGSSIKIPPHFRIDDDVSQYLSEENGMRRLRIAFL